VTQALGVDLSARRGLDLALLDEGRLNMLAHVSDVAATLAWLDAQPRPPRVIGIDAPQGPRRALLTNPARRAALDPPPPEGRYLRYRICDYHLARRGIGLYLSPTASEPAPDWMTVGFTLFDALRTRGLSAPLHARDHAASLLEVYPFAAFVTLLGHVPPRKSTPAGLAARQDALAAAGIVGMQGNLGHDALDAIAAALTASIFSEGGGCALGDPEEGLMVLPVTEDALRARYAPPAGRARREGTAGSSQREPWHCRSSRISGDCHGGRPST
jgi:predicted nuclease with RNAse H fold